ncbi:MHYT domain-containing protein [Sinobacterium caligoides]|nr:MHYT domain-containing protein [Sinobacterium caligoides]
MDFWRFHAIDNGRLAITGELALFVAVLSLTISVLAAYATIIALERAWACDNRKLNNQWALLAALALAIGVWTMHFIGMLALRLPTPIHYDTAITIVSMLPVIFGSFAALKLLANNSPSWQRIQVAALFFTCGVVAMHYCGMEAMTVDAEMTYSPTLLLLSFVITQGLATLAISMGGIAQCLRQQRMAKILAACVAGLAIAGMHYSSMSVVSFYPTIDTATTAAALPPHLVMTDNSTLALVITTISALLIGLLIVSAIFDRRLQSVVIDLQNKSRREQMIVDNLFDGIVVINCNNRIDTFNKAFLKLCQHTGREVDKMQISTLLPALDYHSLLIDSQQSDSRFINKTSRIKLIKKDGSQIFCEATIAPITVNTHILFNASFRDISKREALELQLAHAQKLESIGQLAAGIAHEINTPTQYIASNIAFLKDAFQGCIDSLQHGQTFSSSLSGDDRHYFQQSLNQLKFDFISTEIPQAIEQSLEGLERVSSIVKAMKSFSYPSHGDKHLVDLGEAIATTVTVARNEWRYVADVHLDIASDLPPIDGLRDEINQVLLNMIVNAAHAIEDRYQNNEQKGRIDIVAHFDSEYCYIDIKDDGMGISNEHKKRIFDPFFTTKEVGRGTGQGLSIAYSVINEKHNGAIVVDSHLGKGTTFTIKLPYLQEASQQQEMASSQQHLSQQHLSQQHLSQQHGNQPASTTKAGPS